MSNNGKWMNDSWLILLFESPSFLGASNNNMSQESFNKYMKKYMKKATSGKMGVSLAFVTDATCRYMKDISDEQFSEARKCNHDGSNLQLLYSYPTAPTIV